MPNLHLTCCEPTCNKEFFFKEKDQLFYSEQGFDPPKRCWDCRQERKRQKQDKAISAVTKK